MLPSRLDDPDYAAQAWGRFRRLMGWMTGIAAVCGLIASLAIRWQVQGASAFAIIGTGLGVFASLVMAALLMGLVFLSNGTGHDDAVDNVMPENEP